MKQDKIVGGDQVGCWVSPGWSDGLMVPRRDDWPDVERSEAGVSGIVTVLLTRPVGELQLSVCGYLIDVYCMGVKDALGPWPMDRGDLRAFLKEYFSSYQAPPLTVPLELARQLVFGAADYARALGFAPHPDFQAAAGHLGAWTGRSKITFGRAGRPLFVQGAYDDPDEIMGTLDRTVGRANYDFLLHAEPQYQRQSMEHVY